MSEKSTFRGPLQKKHGKASEALLQSGRRQLYLIC